MLHLGVLPSFPIGWHCTPAGSSRSICHNMARWRPRCLRIHKFHIELLFDSRDVLSTLLLFYDLRCGRRGSAATLTPHQCWCVCDLKNRSETAKEEGKPLLPAMASSHSKGGPASFRPSEQKKHKHNGTFETKGIAHSKKAQGVHTLRQNSKKKDNHPPFFQFLPPPPSPLLSQSVHGERKAFLLRQGASWQQQPVRYSCGRLWLAPHSEMHHVSSDVWGDRGGRASSSIVLSTTLRYHARTCD